MYIDIGTYTIHSSRAPDAYLSIKKILEIRSHICVLGLSILRVSTMFLLDSGNVKTVLYLLPFILSVILDFSWL